jgi:hypothetical protein
MILVGKAPHPAGLRKPGELDDVVAALAFADADRVRIHVGVEVDGANERAVTQPEVDRASRRIDREVVVGIEAKADLILGADGRQSDRQREGSQRETNG